MKRLINKIGSLGLVFGLLFSACQQEEVLENGRKDVNETRAGGVLRCEVTTEAAGQLDSLITVRATEGNYPRASITHLTVSGPINQADIRTMCSLQYLDSLVLSHAEIEVIPEGAFRSFASKAAIMLPEATTQIGHRAFETSMIASVYIPDGVTSIASYAFGHCGNLKSVRLPKNLTSIAEYTFQFCPALTDIVLPEYLTKIGYSAFSNCTALKQVELPDFVTEMDGRVFERCSELETVKWSSALLSIPDYTFYACTKLKFSIPDYVTSIKVSAFHYCQSLTEFNLPPSVKEVGNGAFANTGIQRVTLTAETPLADNMFEGTPLKEVVIEENVATLPAGIFSGCTALKSIQIPASVRSIGARAFSGCTQLETVTLNEGLKTIGSNAFRNTAISSLVIPSTVTTCQGGLVSGCKHITHIYWNSPAEAPDLIQDDERNLLVYLPYGNSHKENLNRIVNGRSQSTILLQSTGDFYCPEAFTTDIKYNRVFAGDIEIGQSSRWQSIVLPFDVTSIKCGDKILAPFGADVKDAKPFWLRELTPTGFVRATKIEANKPYIIAMPYNENYSPEYNISGTVTFSAEGVTIPVTEEPAVVRGATFDFYPSYLQLDKNADRLVLNKSDHYDYANHITYTAGSVFVSALDAVLAFEAYVRDHTGTRCLIPVSDSPATRSAKPVGPIPAEDDM